MAQRPPAGLHRRQRSRRRPKLGEFHTRGATGIRRSEGLWANAWGEFVPFLDYRVEIRRVIYSTNAIESLNARMRRATRARGHFPNEQAALKCLYLTIRSLDPTGKGARPLDEPLETSPQRLRHHLRRPTLPHQQLTTATTSYTVILTDPHVAAEAPIARTEVTQFVASFCVAAVCAVQRWAVVALLPIRCSCRTEKGTWP